jgi:hypothetical protein
MEPRIQYAKTAAGAPGTPAHGEPLHWCLITRVGRGAPAAQRDLPPHHVGSPRPPRRCSSSPTAPGNVASPHSP